MIAPESSDPTDDAPARTLATRQFCLIYDLAVEIAASRAHERTEAGEDESSTLCPDLRTEKSQGQSYFFS